MPKITEHNRAIRQAQKLLQVRANEFSPVEYPGGISTGPTQEAWRSAARALEALIEDDIPHE